MGVAAPVIQKQIGTDDSLIPRAAELVRFAKDMSRADTNLFNPAHEGEGLDSVRHRYAHLEKLIDNGHVLSETLGFKQYQPFLDQLRAQRLEFLKPYSADPGRDFAQLDAQFQKGIVPPRRPDWQPPRPVDVATNNRDTLALRIADFDEMINLRITVRQMRDGFKDLYVGIEKAAESSRTLASQMALVGSPLGPISGVAAGMVRTNDLQIRPDNKIPSHVVDLASRLNDEFDPLPKLMRDKKDMELALKEGIINKSVFDQGWAKEVKSVADRLGAGPVKLPDTILAGSQEDARLLSHFTAGEQKQTTEDLLGQIRDILSRIAGTNSKMADTPVQRPVNFNPFG